MGEYEDNKLEAAKISCQRAMASLERLIPTRENLAGPGLRQESLEQMLKAYTNAKQAIEFAVLDAAKSIWWRDGGIDELGAFEDWVLAKSFDKQCPEILRHLGMK